MASKSQQVLKYLISGAKTSELDLLIPDSRASLQELLARVAQLEASLSGFKKKSKINKNARGAARGILIRF